MIGRRAQTRRVERARLLPMGALAAALLVLVSGGATAQERGLAARVNGEGISRAKLQSSIDASMQRQGMDYGGITQPGQFKRKQRWMLDELIAQELLWQEANDKGFVATPEEVDRALAEVRDNYDSERSYRNALARNGFTEESYREDMKRRISVRRWVRETLAKETTVSDADVHAFYMANQPRFVEPEQARARHVLIELPPEADETAVAAARRKIDAVLAEARAGVDFAELAKTHSDGPSASRGGDLGFLPRGRLVAPFEEAAFALAPGEISDVVRTRYGFHVIKLEARREKRVVPEAEAAPAIREHLRSVRVQEAVEERITALRERAAVEIFIRL